MKIALTSLFLLCLQALVSYANAENPILDQYFDKTLPSFTFKTLPTDARYSDPAYVPTNLKSLDDAQKLLTLLKYNRKAHAECYQRAHLWALEMKQMAKINSQKIFLFFTDKYRRATGFDWWFHVAPFVLVEGKEMVLDPYFFDKPIDVQTWSNYFMLSHPKCMTATSYQDYEQHQSNEDCVFRKMPMFYYEPNHIEARDNENKLISDWIDYQVIASYETLLPWWKR